MSSLKVVGGYIHHVYYDPSIRNNRTLTLNLPDNEKGWIKAKKHLKEYEAKKLLGIDMYAEKKTTPEVNSAISSLPDEYFRAKNIKPSSQGCYKYAIDMLIKAVGDLYLWQISEREVKRLYAYLDTAKKTVRKKVENDGVKEWQSVETEDSLAHNTKANITTHLSILFKFAEMQGLIDKCHFTALDKIKKRPRRVPLDVVKAVLLDLKTKEDKECFYVTLTMLISGFRESTVCALTWDHVDFSHNLIYTPNVKGGREDTFPMPKLLQQVLTLQKERDIQYPNGKVFIYKSRHSFKFWGRALDRLKLPHYTVHQMRKTFVSVLGNSGMLLDDVSFLAGHKDRRTTEESYLEFEYQRLQAEMDKAFDREFGDIFNTNFNTNLSKSK